MYRKDVSVDKDLLEEAMNVAGEDSSSAVVDKALSELVRIARLKRGIQAKETSDPEMAPLELQRNVD